jgi:hypothetical protein
LAFGFCCALPFALMAQQGIDSGPFRIAGTVVNAITGAPLSRARVTIADTRNRQHTRWMITADDGRFVFDQLAAAKYSLTGARRGFIQSAYEEHDEYSTAIVTGTGIDSDNLVLRLPPAAEIDGKVLDESGDPVRNAQVWLYREDYHSGFSRIVPAQFRQTDDLGTYDFSPVEPGTYFLKAMGRPWYAIHPPTLSLEDTGVKAPGVSPSLDVAYPNTYYADATDPDEATPIPIRGGDHPQIEIHLSPVPAAHMIFHCDEQNLQMPNLRVPGLGRLDAVENDGMHSVGTGVCEINGIPEGKYFLQQGASHDDTSNEVTLTQNGEAVDIPKSEAANSVKATVQIAGETTLPSHLSIVLRNSKMHIVAMNEVDDKGAVEFSGLVADKYEILAATSTKRFAVVRISANGSDIAGHILTVSAGSPLNVALTLSPGSVNVEGLVKHTGKPVARAMVVLLPADPENNHDRFRRDQSDLDGSFTLSQVIPGSYTVCAIENGWDLDWAKPAVITHYCRNGKAVKVNESASGTIRLAEAVESQPK